MNKTGVVLMNVLIASMTVVVCLLLSSVVFFEEVPDDGATMTASSPETRGNTLYVGVGQTYKSIQAAIDAASAGDTVRVFAGTYDEQITVDKQLSIIGNSTNTVITYHQSFVIRVSANGTVLSDFKVLIGNGADFNTGIDVASNNNILRNLTIRSKSSGTAYQHNGINLVNSSFNTIYGNDINLTNDQGNNNNIGIDMSLGSDNSWITGNTILEAYISIAMDWNCCNNRITENSLGGRSYYQSALILSEMCSYNLFERNIVYSYCVPSDIYVSQESHYNRFIDNDMDGGIVIGYDSNNTVVSDNTLYSITTRDSSGTTLTNNNLTSIFDPPFNQDSHITLDFSVNTIVRDNTMESGGIYILGGQSDKTDPLLYWVSNTIESNTVHGQPILFLKNDSSGAVISEPNGQIILANCSNAIVMDQQMSNTDIGIQLAFCSYTTVMNNHINNKDERSITLDFCNNCTITDNDCTGGRSDISLMNSHFNTISENRFNDTMFTNIWLIDSDQNLVKNNTMSFAYRGIVIEDYSTNNTIVDNNIKNMKENGITFNFHSHYFERETNDTFLNFNRISNNSIQNCTIGILADEVGFSTFDNNTITKCTVGGIALYNSHNNSLFGNTLRDNKDFGIVLEIYGLSLDISNIYFRAYTSSNNTIYNNYFINNNANTTQSKDGGTNNLWDNGITGNYWSDWTSPDADGDGIVDQPYSINGSAGAMDYLPLTTMGSISDDDIDPNNTDTDADTLPDAWERQYFSNLTYSPNDDPDGDGLSNYQEYLDGTDPTKNEGKTSDLSDWLGKNWLPVALAAVIFLTLVIVLIIIITRRTRKPEVHFEPETRVNGAEKDEKVIECQPDSDTEGDDVAEMDDLLDGEGALEDLKDYKTIAERIPDPDEMDTSIIDLEQEALSEELPSDFRMDRDEMKKGLDEKLENGEITKETYNEMIAVMDEKA